MPQPGTTAPTRIVSEDCPGAAAGLPWIAIWRQIGLPGPDAGGRSQRTANVKQEQQVIQRDGITAPATNPGLGRGGGRSNQIKIHGAEAFEGMRRAGALAAATLDFITPHVRPGIT